MAKNDNYFILVPLGMLKELINDYKTIYNIFDVGTFLSAQKMKTNIETAVKQFVYCLYRNEGCIPTYLRDCVDYMEDFEWDEDYNGFTGDTFEPVDNIKSVLKYAAESEDSKFARELIEWHKTRLMFEGMHVERNGYLPISINRARRILNENNNFEGDPMFTVDSKVINDLYHSAEFTTEEDRAALAMYFGMLTIIGKKTFAASTSFAFQSRMFGAKNKKELDKLLKHKKTRELYEKYTTRRKYEKIRDIVKERYGINYFGYNRLTYITFKLTDDRKFFEAIISANKNRQKKIMMENRHAIMRDVIRKEKMKD